MRFVRLALIFFSLARLTTLAQAEVPYIDDRSDAASLVTSLYNAINRHEYGRAYGYFAEPPAKSFADYEKGFADTLRVELDLGPVSEEGAAGSVFYTVPVAIKSINADKSEKVFAGCYTVRRINAPQEPPVRVLEITSGKLKPSDSVMLEGAYPEACNDIQTPMEASAGEGEAIRSYVALFAASCPISNEVLAGSQKPESWELEKFKSDEEGAPDSKAVLFRFPCSMAAYNESAVYFLATREGLFPVSFVQPDLAISYEDTDSTKLKAMTVKSFSAVFELVNSDFNPTDKTIGTYSKWRGLGDASSNATYAFRDRRFVLTDFDVDPTYNEEMDPIAVIKDGKVQ